MIDVFVSENIEKQLNNFVSINKLWGRYLLFCETHKVEPITKIKLTNELNKMNIGMSGRKQIEYKNYRGRFNIALLPCKY